MAELAALGVAASTVQFIDFGLKTVKICKEIYRSGMTNQHKDLQSHCERLESYTAAFKRQSNPPTLTATSSLGSDERELLAMAKDCEKISEELHSTIRKLYSKPKAVIMLKVLSSKLLSNDKISELSAKLEMHRDDLETRILISLRASATKVLVEQKTAFQSLSNDVKAFVQKLDAGIMTITDLITKELKDTRDLVTTEHQTTRSLVDKRAEGQRDHLDSITTIIQKHGLDEHSKTRDQSSRGFLDVKLTIENETSHLRSHLEQTNEVQASNSSRRDFMDSLAFASMNERHDQIEDAHLGTYEFIFNEPGTQQKWSNFVEWLQDGHDVYWVHGKAGAGKSTLMQFIYNDDRTRTHLNTKRDPSEPEPAMVGFFFWNAGDALMKTSQGLLRSILYQLLRLDTSLYPQILTADTSLRDRPSKLDWSAKDLRQLLDLVLSFFDRPLVIFLDGLDEFDEKIDNLLSIIKMIRTNATISKLKLCVSSRPSNQLQEYFEGCSQLRLQDLTKSSINTYVREWLQEQINASRSENVAYVAHLPYITDQITQDANGIFLWAKLAVGNVVECIINRDSIEMVLDVLRELPSELDQMYQRMWDKINLRRYQTQSMLYFQLILIKELSLLQMLFATDTNLKSARNFEPCAMNYDTICSKCTELRAQIPSRCGGLLEVNKRARFYEKKLSSSEERAAGEVSMDQLEIFHHETIVQFTHRTARDFVLTKLMERKDTSSSHYQLLILRSRYALELLREAPRFELWYEINYVAGTVIVDIQSPGSCTIEDNVDSSFLHQAFWLLDSLLRNVATNVGTRASIPLGINFIVAEDLLGAWIEYNHSSDWTFVAVAKLSELKQVSREYLGYLLRCALVHTAIWGSHLETDMVFALLSKGADPMSRRVNSIGEVRRNPARWMSAWSLVIQAVSQTVLERTTFNEFHNLTNLVESFVRQGASLMSRYPFVVRLNEGGGLTLPQSFQNKGESDLLVLNVSPGLLLQCLFGMPFMTKLVPEGVDDAHDLVLVKHDRCWYRVSSQHISEQILGAVEALSNALRRDHDVGGREGQEIDPLPRIRPRWELPQYIDNEVRMLCTESSLITRESDSSGIVVSGWTEETVMMILAQFLGAQLWLSATDMIRMEPMPRAILESVPGDLFRNLPEKLFEYDESDWMTDNHSEGEAENDEATSQGSGLRRHRTDLSSSNTKETTIARARSKG